MNHVYTIKAVRSTGYTDRYEYAVIAPNAANATKKAIKQAELDSGFKTGWDVTELTKGHWVVT